MKPDETRRRPRGNGLWIQVVSVESTPGNTIISVIVTPTNFTQDFGFRDNGGLFFTVQDDVKKPTIFFTGTQYVVVRFDSGAGVMGHEDDKMNGSPGDSGATFKAP